MPPKLTKPNPFPQYQRSPRALLSPHPQQTNNTSMTNLLPYYDGPSKNDIYLLIHKFNTYHSHDQHINILGFTDIDKATILSLEEAEKIKKANHSGIQIVARSLRKDLQNIESCDNIKDLGPAAIYGVISKAKSLLKTLENPDTARTEVMTRKPYPSADTLAEHKDRVRDSVTTTVVLKTEVPKEREKEREHGSKSSKTEDTHVCGKKRDREEVSPAPRSLPTKTRLPHPPYPPPRPNNTLKAKNSREELHVRPVIFKPERSTDEIKPSDHGSQPKTTAPVDSNVQREKDRRKERKAKEARDEALRLASEVRKF